MGRVSDAMRSLWRSAKAAMSCEAAYKVLLDMGPKLDQELVREFEAVARKG